LIFVLGIRFIMVVALLSASLPVSVVRAATITVAAGEVAVLENNTCSLREAIINANDDAQTHDDCSGGSGADTIVLASGSTYTLTDAVDMTDGANGLPSITSQITINGNGATIRRDPSLTCTLDGTTGTMGLNIEFRIFHIGSGGNLTLNTITVRNGCADSSTFPTYTGAGIFISGSGAVTITNSTLSGNSARFHGGGIFSAGGTDTVTISNSTLSGNSAMIGQGGGISGGATVTISNSTLSGNSAGNLGGGIHLFGTATITNSTLSGNSASGGGGIGNSGGMLTINNSTVSGNSAANGAGIFIVSGATLTISNSTLSSNSASSQGGSIFSSGTTTTVTITNSTLSNNSANFGGGIVNFSSTVTISNSTLSGNSAGTQGGGIYNFFSTSIVNIKNSIVANSPSGGNCSNTGTFNPTGTNLASDATCPGFTHVTSAQLNLGPLQVNPPGTTATHALNLGSAAFNAVTDCTLQDGVTPVTQDQRGVPRPQGGLCDVGAYEFIIQPGTYFALQGAGSSLTLSLMTRQYVFRAGERMIIGTLTFSQQGPVIRFQNIRGDNKLLRGWINLSTGRASAVLILPQSLGGGRFIFNN
jgi:hypothetical protein